MPHYFTNEPGRDEPCLVSFVIDGQEFTLQSNAGVFSKEKLDTGTRILLETVLSKQPAVKSVLDLGCGIGVVGVVLSHFWHCDVEAIDVSQKACALARENFEKYGVKAEVFCQDGISPEQGKYGAILLNPPIRTGKETIYRLFEQAYSHLEEQGNLWIVIRKQHGAESAMKYLKTLSPLVKRVSRDKGFWILCVTKG